MAERNRNTYESEQYTPQAWGKPLQRTNHFRSGRETTTGCIKRFFNDRGFGFIHADDIEERVFFHQNQLMPGVVPSTGTRVSFRLARNDEGYIAENIDTEDETWVCMYCTFFRGWTTHHFVHQFMLEVGNAISTLIYT